MRQCLPGTGRKHGLIKIDEKGEHYGIVWGLVHGGRPTSELPTHLAAHELKKKMTNGTNRIIYHAHPTNLIALTFVLPLKDKEFTRELWEMATEDPVIFPEGIGVVPGWYRAARKLPMHRSNLWRNTASSSGHIMACSFAAIPLIEAFGSWIRLKKPRKFVSKSYRWAVKNRRFLGRALIQLAKDFHIDLNTELLD